LIQRGGQGRSLRRLGGTGTLLGRDARRVQATALDDNGQLAKHSDATSVASHQSTLACSASGHWNTSTMRSRRSDVMAVGIGEPMSLRGLALRSECAGEQERVLVLGGGPPQ